MPASFRIYPERDLVHVRYTGHARVDEGHAAFGAYLKHPDYRPGQKQLVDLSGITGFEADFAELIALQARKAEAFLTDGPPTMIVYFATTPEALRMCQMILRSWEGISSVIARVLESEEDALAVLGDRATRLEDLF
jgi:hypothetical protein